MLKSRKLKEGTDSSADLPYTARLPKHDGLVTVVVEDARHRYDTSLQVSHHNLLFVSSILKQSAGQATEMDPSFLRFLLIFSSVPF